MLPGKLRTGLGGDDQIFVTPDAVISASRWPSKSLPTPEAIRPWEVLPRVPVPVATRVDPGPDRAVVAAQQVVVASVAVDVGELYVAAVPPTPEADLSLGDPSALLVTAPVARSRVLEPARLGGPRDGVES